MKKIENAHFRVIKSLFQRALREGVAQGLVPTDEEGAHCLTVRITKERVEEIIGNYIRSAFLLGINPLPELRKLFPNLRVALQYANEIKAGHDPVLHVDVHEFGRDDWLPPLLSYKPSGPDYDPDYEYEVVSFYEK